MGLADRVLGVEGQCKTPRPAANATTKVLITKRVTATEDITNVTVAKKSRWITTHDR